MGPNKLPPFIPASRTSGESGPVSKTNNKGQTQSRGKKISVEVNPMHGSKSLLDLNALVRSVQRAEGEEACFKVGRFDCDDSDCRWRDYCLEQGQSGKG